MYECEIIIAEHIYKLKTTSTKREPVLEELYVPSEQTFMPFYQYTKPYKYNDIIVTQEDLLNSLVDTDAEDNT